VETKPGAGAGENRPAKQRWLQYQTSAQFFSLWTLIFFTVVLGDLLLRHSFDLGGRVVPKSPTVYTQCTHCIWILVLPHQGYEPSCSSQGELHLKIPLVIIDIAVFQHRRLCQSNPILISEAEPVNFSSSGSSAPAGGRLLLIKMTPKIQIGSGSISENFFDSCSTTCNFKMRIRLRLHNADSCHLYKSCW